MKLSKIETTWGDGLRLETGALALEVTTAVGPRITAFASKKGKAGNLFAELGADVKSPYGFSFRGGHRLWHAPEHPERTYQHDDQPCALKPVKNGIAIAQPLEQLTGIQKAVKIELLGERTVRVTHAISNHGLWPVETSAWALSMFRSGGYAVVPLPPKGEHSPDNLLPSHTVVTWSYTDLSHEGWELHRDFYGANVSAFSSAQKIGLSNYPGWSAYHLAGTTFVKHAAAVAGAAYPDMGSAFELFTNGEMCELETLSPFTRLAPGDSIQHVEHWTLFDGLKRPDTDAAFAKLRDEAAKWLGGLKV